MGVALLSLVFASAAVVLSLSIFSDNANSAGWVRHESVVVGANPYRSATSTGTVRVGAPRWAVGVCWLSAMGGLATFMLFAPVCLVMSDATYDPYGPTSVVRPFVTFFVSLSGFPAGMVLIRAARQTVRRERVGELTFGYLYAHHACVAGPTILVQALSPEALLEVPVSLAFCSLMFALVVAMDCVAVPLGRGAGQNAWNRTRLPHD